MVITLKTGKKVDLQITPLLLEYVKKYEGGIDQLKIDIENPEKQIQAVNYMLYSVVASNYGNDKLSKRQILKLIDIRDMQKIADFVVDSLIKK